MVVGKAAALAACWGDNVVSCGWAAGSAAPQARASNRMRIGTSTVSRKFYNHKEDQVGLSKML